MPHPPHPIFEKRSLFILALAGVMLLAFVVSVRRQWPPVAPQTGQAQAEESRAGQPGPIKESSGHNLSPARTDKAAETKLVEAYGKLPLSFEANEGQTDERVKFSSRGQGYALFLTQTEAVLSLNRAEAGRTRTARHAETAQALPEMERREHASHQRAVVRMRLKGANPLAAIEGAEALPGTVNYFKGQQPDGWRTGIKTYSRVRYSGIYPGVDLVYYGKQRQLEYDFNIAPGTNPGVIELAFEGMKSLSLNESGDLALHTEGGEVRLHQPIAYQEVEGARRLIGSRYVLSKENRVSIRVDQYDPLRPLVIDPVLAYSTYYGGNGLDEGYGIAVDSDGNAYVTGYTDSTDLSLANPLQNSSGGGASDAFVMKLNPVGNNLVYTTYLGGAGSEEGHSIAVDASGDAYVTGVTDSSDFPLANPLQAAKGGASDAFVARLNAAGGALLYSTYLGGGGADAGNGIALDAGGDAYVAGKAVSNNFPTSNALQATKLGRPALKSTNGGSSFNASETGLFAQSVNSLAFDPAALSTLYAGTEMGVFKTIDGGNHWSQVGAGQIGSTVNRVLVDPSSSSRIYAATEEGFYWSTNGGNNWTRTNTSLFSDLQNLVAAPTAPTTLYAAGRYSGILKSTNGGVNWTPLNGNGVDFGNVMYSLALDPSNSSTLYAGTINGFFKSTDGGNNWTTVDTGPDRDAVLDIAIAPSNPATIYIAMWGIVEKSTDGGNNWTNVTPAMFPARELQLLKLAVDPANASTLYLYGSNRGNFKSTDGGNNWTGINLSSTEASVKTLLIEPANASNIYAGIDGGADAFVAKINPNGSALLFSTYLGGGRNDYARSIALDASGNAYLTGFTDSTGFPLVNPLQSANKGGGDAFVTKLKSDGAALIYSTFLGGTGLDYGSSIAVDSMGNAYLTGVTGSENFPLANAIQPLKNFNYKVFVTKLNTAGSALAYSTYLGGSDDDEGYGIAVDAQGNAYVTGYTSSTNFPVVSGFQTQKGRGTGSGFDTDAFLSKLKPDGSALVYSTYLGGGRNDYGLAITVNSAGEPYLTGSTASDNYPLAVPLQPTLALARDLFITKFSDANPSSNVDLSLSMDDSQEPVETGTNLIYSLTVTNKGTTAATDVTLIDGLPEGLNSISTRTTQGACSGTTTVKCNLGTLDKGATATVTITVSPKANEFLTNTVTVSSHEPDAQPADNTIIRTTLAGFLDLFLSNTPSLNLVPAGGTITYILTVKNKGVLAANHVGISAPLSDAVSFVSCTVNAMPATCDGTGHLLGVNLGVLASGATATATITVRLNAQAGAGASLSQLATVFSDKPDHQPADNAATATSIIVPKAAPQVNGKIVFTSNLNEALNDEIYVMNADGGAVTRLTHNPATDRSPVWSPDGSKIAFISTRDGTTGDIYWMNADGSSVTRLTNFGGKESPTWSPDGTRIAYVTNKQRIDATNVDGSGQRTIVYAETGQLIYDASWSPDGAKILYGAQGMISEEVLLVNVDGSLPRYFTYDLSSELHPRWSPDGSQIVVSSNRKSGTDSNPGPYREIYALNFDGTGIKRLTNLQGYAENPVWSPDGSRIAFALRQQGAARNTDIYLINSDGTHLSRLTNNSVYDDEPDWQTVSSTLPTIQFSASTFSASENAGSAVINVIRTGDTTKALSVDYTTGDGTAKQRSDYTAANGTLNFAPGETSKSLNVLLTDNSYVDGNRTVYLLLGNATGAATSFPSMAVLTITDNDAAQPTTNPIDDAQFFVRQQYADFLNRAPDPGGLGYWTNEINKCGNDARCIHDRRVGVADAFFFETEFQQTGAYIYRIYRAALGLKPTYAQFISDRGRVVAGPGLDQSKSAYALFFTQRADFQQAYATTTTADQFVDKMLTTVKQNSGVDLSAQRNSLISLYDGTDTGRAAILRQVAESQALIDAEYNQSFVLMEYFGYLRRDPDQGGYEFWLSQVNKFPLRNVSIQQAMACSFITSEEYQTRFSSMVTHTNRECPQ